MQVVRARSVVRIYGDGERRSAALRGVDLDIEAGELVAVMGPSGSGKSTLLHLLGALDSPTSGSIMVEGRELAGLGDGERTALRRSRIGFVFQQFHLIAHLTVAENVALPLLTAGRPKAERRERTVGALAAVGLSGVAERFPHEVSGGEQQRVAIARALVHEPALVLADEPTGNLDTDTGRQVMERLSASRSVRSHAVVVVTHDAAVASLADRVVRLRDGRLESVDADRAPPG